MVQRGAARRQLAEHHVTVGHDGQRAERAQAAPVPMRAGSGSVANAPANTCDSVSSASAPMPMLASVIPNWLADSRRARLAVARSTMRALASPAARHRFEAGAARADDGELRRHEEAIQGEKPDDGENASEHERNVTLADVSTPLARAS